jgi:hypothetical protein
MRIVIFGLARSGTTALFYLLKDALPAGTQCLFEPHAFRPGAVDGLLRRMFRSRRERDVLAKVLPFRPTDPADAESFEAFDRQILTVRDPRDRIVSRLLYVVRHSTFYGSDERMRRFMNLLERKEADPGSVTIGELLRVQAEIGGETFSLEGWGAAQARHSVGVPLEFHDRRPHLFLCRYEDLVDRNLAALEGYLDRPLPKQAVVAPQHQHVERTKGYGSWRNWFTDEDIRWLRPILAPYLERYYEGGDWTLNSRPAIPAAFSSGYVTRIVNERRAAEGLPPFTL